VDGQFHAGGGADWSLDEAVIRELDAIIGPDVRSLETGAGRSTIEIVRRGATHTAVTPSASEIQLLRAALAEESIDASRLTFVEGYSQDVLPGLTGELDFVLIDGGHGFPIPQVDWTYTAPRLRVGGHLMIDDVDLWTGKILVDFLKEDPKWEFVRLIRGRTVLFKLVRAFTFDEWSEQPFVARRSKGGQTRRKLVNALGHLAHGEVDVLLKKFRHDRDLAAARGRPSGD